MHVSSSLLSSENMCGTRPFYTVKNKMNKLKKYKSLRGPSYFNIYIYIYIYIYICMYVRMYVCMYSEQHRWLLCVKYIIVRLHVVA